MDTLDKQALGVMALEFLEDLDHEDGDDGEYYAAILIVADLDDEGDIRVSMRTSDSNSISNIRVLHEAQLLETRNAVEAGE